MKKPRSEEEAKRKLAGKLGGPVREDIWAAMVEERCVQEYEDGIGSLNDLLKRYKFYQRHFLKTPTKKPEKAQSFDVLPDRRLEVLSEVLAIEASLLPEVHKFREEVLGGRLLTTEEVPEWIERQRNLPTGYQIGGRFTPAEEVPDFIKFPRDMPTVALLVPLSYKPHDPRNQIKRKYESMGLPGPPDDLFPARITVARDGVLGRLKRIAAEIANRTPWKEEKAVAFILTGAIPLLPKATAKIMISNCIPPRINLTLDPRLCGQEVAEIYNKVRYRILRSGDKPGRDKPMTEKHLRLAVFLAEVQKKNTWADLMGVWNKKHPEWKYTNYMQFSRDIRAAYARVTGREWIKPDLRPTVYNTPKQKEGDSNGKETR